MSAKGIRINKSKIVHRYYESSDRTSCGAGGMGDVSHNGGTPTTDAVTCKRCIRCDERDAERAVNEAARIKSEINAQHAEVLAEDVERSHTAHWVADQSGMWRAADGTMLTCDMPVRRGTFGHEGACYDRVAGVQRHALTLSRSARKANRRAAAAKLRRTRPQTHAAGRARRTQRGTARATAKTLLVAVGVPQGIADRYAGSFSRGTKVRTASARVRLGRRNSKRVEVKRYTWDQFVGRLTGYHPGSHLRGDVAAAFSAARDRVLAMA